MAFCTKCGQQVDGQKFCTACGNPMDNGAQQNTQQASYTNPGATGTAGGSILDTPDYTASFHPQDIQNNKGMGVLSYLGILFLIPLLAAKDSPFAKFHANQGLVLFIAELIISIPLGIIIGILTVADIPFIGLLLRLVSFLPYILAILGIVNAANGKAKELPLIGKFRIIK